ncbi:uncharacterized protein LOC125110791 [Phacochoerus africanus]|uniref:uncharacterized protein LOC125110791 n=1 Tax=Phacochoerus africanus TaxID=41426 RepID=UPI001FD9C80A|nr:uncharacterized protein LOC125110791 [Phacochoerus africanus]
MEGSMREISIPTLHRLQELETDIPPQSLSFPICLEFAGSVSSSFCLFPHPLTQGLWEPGPSETALRSPESPKDGDLPSIFQNNKTRSSLECPPWRLRTPEISVE